MEGVSVLWIDGDDEIYSSFAVSTWWTSRSDGGSDLPWMSEPSYPQRHANFLQHTIKVLKPGASWSPMADKTGFHCIKMAFEFVNNMCCEVYFS